MTTVGEPQTAGLPALLQADLHSAALAHSDEVPATGTGTLIIQLGDVNDNAPIIEERQISVRVSHAFLPSCSEC